MLFPNPFILGIIVANISGGGVRVRNLLLNVCFFTFVILVDNCLADIVLLWTSLDKHNSLTSFYIHYRISFLFT